MTDVNEAWLPGKLTTIVGEFDKALDDLGADFPFLNFSGISHTLGQLDRDSRRLAHGLRSAGARVGECVASVLDNGVEQVLLLLACSRIGAVHVPLNTAYKGEYLRHQVADCGAVVLVAEKEYVQRLIDIEGGLPEARVLLVKGEMPEGPSGVLDVRPLASAMGDAGQGFDMMVKPGDLAMLIYTAGTTGPSKGCMISQSYACNMGRQISENMLYTRDDVIWTPLPGFHLNQYTTTIIGALMARCRAAVYPRFSVSRFWPELERTGATVVQILSSMITLIGDAADNDAQKRYFGKLRLLAGTPIPEKYQTIWKTRFGVEETAQICFGLTECALVTSVPIDVERPPTHPAGTTTTSTCGSSTRMTKRCRQARRARSSYARSAPRSCSTAIGGNPRQRRIY